MDIASLLEVEVKEGKPSELHTNVTAVEDVVPNNRKPSATISHDERHYYKLMFGSDIASVRFRKLHCTACDIHIGSAPAQAHNMQEHPILHVLLCTSCRNFYGDGTFEQGDDATDMFCRWCANGGNLYCCSYCSNTFCYACIKRNFDPFVRKKIERDEKWKCFVCNPADLYSARAACWALLQHVQTVTRILQSDRKMTPEEVELKMNLDESQCCPHKSKRKRADTPTDDEEEDETYTVPKRKRRKILSAKRPKRRLIKLEMTEPDGENPRQLNSNRGTRSDVRAVNSPGHSTEINPKNDEIAEDVPLTGRQTRRRLRSRSSNRTSDVERSKFTINDDDIPPPLLQCDQSMVEGAESLSFGALSPANRTPAKSMTRMGITPVPTAHLLKRPVVGPAVRGGGRDHRIIRGVSGTPVYVRKVPHLPPNMSQAGNNTKNSGTQSMPMVSIPSRNHMPQSPNRINVIQPPLQNSGIVRNVAPGGLLRQIRPRIVLAKPVSNPNAAKKIVNNQPPSVIDLESEEDEAPFVYEPPTERVVSESNNRVPELSTTTYPVRPDDGILTILSSTPKSDGEGEHSEAEEGDESEPEQRPQEGSRSFEAAIRGPTKSIDDVLDTLKNKLKKVLESAMIFTPDRELVAAKAKTRAVNRTIKRTVEELSSLSDNLISAYQAYKRECRKEPVPHTPSVTLKKKEKSNKIITLDMLCTRESESEDNESASDEDSDNSQDMRPVREIRPFRRRANVGVDAKPETEEKSVQVYDVVIRDYEKSVGYALLLKADYDPKSQCDILRPVMVPDKNFGKYEEEFISYLQHIEDNRTETDVKEHDDDSAVISVNELIEADFPDLSNTGENTDPEKNSENTAAEEPLKNNDENVEILDEHLEISITTTATHSSSSDSDSDSSSSDSETGTSEAGSPRKKKSKENPDDQSCENKVDDEQSPVTETLENEENEENAENGEIESGENKEKDAEDGKDEKEENEEKEETLVTEESTTDDKETKDETHSECKNSEETSQATEEETVLAVRALIEEDSSENSNSNPALNSWKPVESDDECTVLD